MRSPSRDGPIFAERNCRNNCPAAGTHERGGSRQMVEDEHSEPGAGVAADAAVRVEIGIEIIDGPDRHVRYDAGGPEMTIGTSPENDLVLTDPSVAAHHLWLRVRDGVLV